MAVEFTAPPSHRARSTVETPRADVYGISPRKIPRMKGSTLSSRSTVSRPATASDLGPRPPKRRQQEHEEENLIAEVAAIAAEERQKAEQRSAKNTFAKTSSKQVLMQGAAAEQARSQGQPHDAAHVKAMGRLGEDGEAGEEGSAPEPAFSDEEQEQPGEPEPEPEQEPEAEQEGEEEHPRDWQDGDAVAVPPPLPVHWGRRGESVLPKLAPPARFVSAREEGLAAARARRVKEEQRQRKRGASARLKQEESSAGLRGAHRERVAQMNMTQWEQVRRTTARPSRHHPLRFAHVHILRLVWLQCLSIWCVLWCD